MSVARQADLAARIQALGPWFHNLDIGGIETAPEHFLGDYPRFKWARFAHVLPQDLAGAQVLDIGCNGGFYAIEMMRRGAGRVVAIDSDARYLAQARFAAEASGTQIDFRQMSVYNIGALGERFDLVIFMGVFYHLRHPLLALDLIHETVARDLLLFQSMQGGSDEVAPVPENRAFGDPAAFAENGAPVMHFLEHRYADDPTNWWVPNRACMEAMLRSAGFAIQAHPEPEVYLCRKGVRPPMVDRPPRIAPG